MKISNCRQLKTAVIGCGVMGWNNLECLLKSDHIAQIVCVEPDKNRIKETQKKFGIPVFEDYNYIIADKSIDLTYITSPGRYHAEQAILALRNGKKVMSEKPLGISPDQLEDVLKVQKETGGFIQVGFECRYSKLYRRIKTILDSGEIGQVKNINFNYHLSPYPKDDIGGRNWKFTRSESGGMFQEKLCHYVDLVRWWIREPVIQFFCVQAPNTIPYYEIPDNIQTTFRFKNGAVAHLCFMMQVAESGNENLMNQQIDIQDQVNDGHKLFYVIAGTEGAIEASVFHRELRIFHHPGKPGYGSREHLVRVERWTREEDYTYFHDTHTQNLDVARRVAEGLPPGIDLEDAAETMRLCFEMEQAAVENHWTVVNR